MIFAAKVQAVEPQALVRTPTHHQEFPTSSILRQGKDFRAHSFLFMTN